MKVLIVEDDLMLQRLYMRTLELAGCTIVNALDGSQALAQATAEQPDVILMDVMMPQMNGIQALQQLKASESTKTIPVIMLSANDDAIVMQQALLAGADRYLVKSNVEPSQIFSFIQETVAKTQGIAQPSPDTGAEL